MKYIFLSYHHYKYSRSGGVIELAKAMKLSGEEVTFLFAGFPLLRRFFITDNRYTYKWLRNAFRIKQDDLGIRFGVWLSFGLWSLLDFSFIKFINKYIILNDWIIRPILKESDVLVIESCIGLMYIEKILSVNPGIKVLYRPSDPMNYWCSNQVILASEKTVLSISKSILVKNRADYDYYCSLGCTNVEILPNFISLDITHNWGSRSALLDHDIWNKKVALYVGVMNVCWDTIFKLSIRFKDWNFVIVIPILPSSEVKIFLKNSTNVFWFNGVDRSSIGSLVEKCNLFLVPYIRGYYEKYKWGLSAKYLMAMYFRKGILAINEDPMLSQFGIVVCNQATELFVRFSELSMKLEFNYEYELVNGNWLMNADKVKKMFYGE